MQELRFVLIIVGALAIAALLFHGLWTSKKEGKAKFGDKPLGKLKINKDEQDDIAEPTFAPEDDFEIIRKERKEPDFSATQTDIDPLTGEKMTSHDDEEQDKTPPPFIRARREPVEEELPSVEIQPEPEPEPRQEPVVKPSTEDDSKATPEDDLQVIVLNVHCSGSEPFVGTKLFDSMQQNGLLYGELDIFHRHADMSGTGKVLFSVANMMQPGTLKHDDPETFTTKGISFFMTLPCYGDPEQNFKLMLKTAQQIADDLSGNVLDDKRNLITPDKLDTYRAQIQKFKAQQSA
ncbi:cell division protein ZipA [Vibrio olivae]|uniref:Cell division protein ZipA n=1 Tax=Vibrio olivae TaxID=1243002 RepID=A0ABV5HH12_9VIBR